ncbi:MAG: nucleotide exchange factor GrpE [Syntrophobacterales bacterium]|nr:nucleotide exchange factor GrpE [Syntrophobacterales bacterium]
MVKKRSKGKDKKIEDIQMESSEEASVPDIETEPAESKEKLIEELEKTRKEAAENYDKYLRVTADLENFKKRAIKERADAINYGNERLIKDILPIVDSLERALDHAYNSEDFDAFVEGLKLIYDKILVSLKKHGVERIDAAGKDFDPNFHEAMSQVETEEFEDNKIVEEFEKGYLLNGRLLRPVKVSISKNISREKQT